MLREDNAGSLVIKFGGTSVGDGAAFIRAAKIVAGAALNRPVAVVVSAMGGTTDTLLGHAGNVSRGSGNTKTGATRVGSIGELHRTLSERHLRAAHEAVSEEYLPEVEERISDLLKQLAEAIDSPVEKAAARRSRIAVFGERLSSTILAGAISSLGAPAEVVPADPIATDSHYAEAEVDPEDTRERCTWYVRPLLDAGRVAVVPGFGGRSPEGEQTTLGRGGSDLSATTIGRALDSGEVWIMSDVDGVLDADPRLVPDATLLPQLSYRQAGTFASLGAKVLHHKTMEPAAASEMEVFVRNTFNPDSPGTRVTSYEEDGSGIRCVALRRNMKVEGPCIGGHKSEAATVVCIGSPEKPDSARGLKSLRRAGIRPLHYGLATVGLVFMVREREAEEALRVLHGELVRGAEGNANALVGTEAV